MSHKKGRLLKPIASEIRVLDTFFPLIMFGFVAVIAVLSFLLQKAIDVLQESMLVIKQSKLSDIRHPSPDKAFIYPESPSTESKKAKK